MLLLYSHGYHEASNHKLGSYLPAAQRAGSFLCMRSHCLTQVKARGHIEARPAPGTVVMLRMNKEGSTWRVYLGGGGGIGGGEGGSLAAAGEVGDEWDSV